MSLPAMQPGPPATSTDQLMHRLLLTREQVAAVLGVPESTVDYLHRVRTLRAVKVGKHLAWKPEAVRQYVESLEPEA